MGMADWCQVYFHCYSLNLSFTFWPRLEIVDYVMLNRTRLQRSWHLESFKPLSQAIIAKRSKIARMNKIDSLSVSQTRFSSESHGTTNFLSHTECYISMKWHFRKKIFNLAKDNTAFLSHSQMILTRWKNNKKTQKCMTSRLSSTKTVYHYGNVTCKYYIDDVSVFPRSRNNGWHILLLL